jgi:hypothetical protein
MLPGSTQNIPLLQVLPGSIVLPHAPGCFNELNLVFVMILCQWLELCHSVGEELVLNSTGTLNTQVTYLPTKFSFAET